MLPFCARPKRSDYTGNDVLGGAKDMSIMADKREKKGGVNYCSAGGPNKTNCSNRTGTPDVSMHYFPSDETLRNKWTRFVCIHRKDFHPKKSSCLCSVHFEESCFEHKPILVANQSGQAIELKKTLIKGSIPTKDTVVPYKSLLTDRKRRKISTAVITNTSRSIKTRYESFVAEKLIFIGNRIVISFVIKQPK